MKKIMIIVSVQLLFIFFGGILIAQEEQQPIEEEEVMEEDEMEVDNESVSQPVQTPQLSINEEIRQAILSYVDEKSQKYGHLNFLDQPTQKLYKLQLKTVRTDAKERWGIYKVTVDFKEVNTQDAVSLQFDLQNIDGTFNIVDFRLLPTEEGAHISAEAQM